MFFPITNDSHWIDKCESYSFRTCASSYATRKLYSTFTVNDTEGSELSVNTDMGFCNCRDI